MEVLRRLHSGSVRYGSRPLRHGQHRIPGDDRRPRWRAWATLSRCGIMRRCTCCWSRENRAAASTFATAVQRGCAGSQLAAAHSYPSGGGAPPGRAHRLTDHRHEDHPARRGRAHLKHTEGGDFRQATYRAVRHGPYAGRERAAGAVCMCSGWRCPPNMWAVPWLTSSDLAANSRPRSRTGSGSVLAGAAPVEQLRRLPGGDGGLHQGPGAAARFRAAAIVRATTPRK